MQGTTGISQAKEAAKFMRNIKARKGVPSPPPKVEIA